MATTTIKNDAGIGLTLSGFTFLVHEANEGETGFWGEVLELPGCLSQGETLQELIANLQEALDALGEHSTSGTPPADSALEVWPTAETFTA